MLSMAEVYLDNCATTQVHSEVAKLMMTALREDYGNPSSAHRRGQVAEQMVKRARRQVADILRVKAGEIHFTSGGTESNNWALMGTAITLAKQGKRLVTTQVEHPSVLEVFRHLEDQGFQVIYVPVDEYGLIKLGELATALSSDTILVSTMHVNNEVGAVMPLAEVSQLLKERAAQAVWHVDAVQSFGRLPLFPRELGIDLVSISGHKIQGPKGAGALFVRSGLGLKPLLYGGGQEDGYRSGTENVPGIVGLGLAAELMWAQRESVTQHWLKLKDRLCRQLMKDIPDVFINGPQGQAAAAHILNLSFSGLKGEVLLHALEDKGIYVATGAACSSRRAPGSHVLAAMGLPPWRRDGAIRLSFYSGNTMDEIDYTARCLGEIVPQLRRIMQGPNRNR